jgi:hypothetical protein
MLKATWRRLGSPAWLVIGLFALIPSLAEAQLFPNRTIRRERPPCAAEPPFNAQVRRDYFGYYPTCWTRFPAGWACPCPNPELPNPAASYEKNPLGRKRDDLDDAPRPGMDDANPDAPADGMPGNPPAEGRDIPLPNPGRSPFDLDTNPKPPGTDPANPQPPAPGPGGRPSTSAGLMEMPKLPSTSPSASVESPGQPGSIAMAPDAVLTSNDLSDPRPDLGPLPSSPQPSSNSTASAAPNAMPVVGAPAPAQAPRRRGFLSGLFGGNTRNR